MKNSHYLMMGDFNFSGIDLKTYSAKRENSDENKFIECLQDNFLFQSVTKPTRWRGTNKPNLLDLIITDDENSVCDIEYQSPLGKSDHCVITFNYMCGVLRNNIQRVRRCYNKANYDNLKQEMGKVNWKKYLCAKSVDEAWKLFCDKIYELEDKHVPVLKTSGKNRKQIPLNREIITTIKEKNSLSRKFIATKDPAVRTRYNRTRNQVVKLVRKTYRRKQSQTQNGYGNILTQKAKVEKELVSCVLIRRIRNLRKTNEDSRKADILADFFSSVFTVEPEGDIPSLEEREVDTEWTDINIKDEDIQNFSLI